MPSSARPQPLRTETSIALTVVMPQNLQECVSDMEHVYMCPSSVAWDLQRKAEKTSQGSEFHLYLKQCPPEQPQKNSRIFHFTNIKLLNPGQPDNNNYKENCVEMWGTDPNFKWNDGPCDYKKAFVCKAPATADGDVNCPDCGDATDPPGDCK